LGIVIVILIAGIWFLPITLVHGGRFWNEFVYQHHFVRYTTSQFHTSGGPFYYLPFLLLGSYPWTFTPFLGFTDKSADESRLKRFGICWLITIVLFFSFSGSKLPGYILPAAPAFFVLSGLAVTDFLESSKKRARWVIAVVALNLSVIVAMWLEFPDYFQQYSSIRILVSVILGCTLLSAILCWIRKRPAAVVVCALPVLVSIYLFLHDFIPQSGWNMSKQLAFQANKLLTSRKKLLLYNIYAFDMVFYTNGLVELTPQGYFPKVENAQQLYDYVRQNKTAFVLVGNDELSWIEPFSYWKVKSKIRGKDRSIVELESRR
jgi:4-amino-4-deoxy-L-arabinose transferase-like glycosyltransferase